VDLIPTVAEVIAEKEVRAFVVVGGAEGKFCRFASALDGQGVRLAFLLARNRGKVEIAELERALDAKEALSSTDELSGRL